MQETRDLVTSPRFNKSKINTNILVREYSNHDGYVEEKESIHHQSVFQYTRGNTQLSSALSLIEKLNPLQLDSI